MSDGRDKKDGLDPRERGEAAVIDESEQRVERPRLYKVLLLNDDYTTMEFVVRILMDLFHHPEARALEIMLAVHRAGAGVAGVYPLEVAETKAHQAMEAARREEFPLRCAVEPT